MNPSKLPELVEAATGLATCEDGDGDLNREIADLAAAIKADPHYQLLAKVVAAGNAIDTAAGMAGVPGIPGEPIEVVNARMLSREAVALAEAVGLEGPEEE